MILAIALVPFLSRLPALIQIPIFAAWASSLVSFALIFFLGWRSQSTQAE